MSTDVTAVFRSEGGGELERLSALETLKGLQSPDKVTLEDLVAFLESRGLWSQFSKITMGDLRDAFTQKPQKKKKRRILAEALEGVETDGEALPAPKKEKKEPADGGIETAEVARMVLPFVEGNGDVSLDDIADYTRLEKKVLRHHLGLLCKEGRLERLGTGRHAVYSSLL